MENIINNTLKALNKNSTLDEIKIALKTECGRAEFSIDETDWDYMITEILYRLAD